MKIFLCWSEDRSKSLARALRDSLPKFIPTGLEKPFFSEDIAKGTRWFDEVSDELDGADAGLVCVTREALQSGWIHFEAGALARAVRKKGAGTLYTYLVGVEPHELKGPLSEFQFTKFDREDTKKLIASIVMSMKDRGPGRDAWEKAFDEHWERFDGAVKDIEPLPAGKLIPDLEQLFRRKTFNEPLDECSRQSWIDRYTGVQETLGEMRKYAQAMKADNSYLLDLYNELIGQLDGYAMDMAALLLREEEFKIGGDGRLLIDGGIKKPCEKRRRHIKQLVTHMLAPNCAPVLGESRRFAKMSTFEEKKALVIHPIQWEIQGMRKDKKLRDISKKQLGNCAVSWWEFDRIYFYLVQENSDSPSTRQLVECIDQEFEKLRATDGEASLIPLHYAVRALKEAFSRPAGRRESAELKPRIRTLFARLADFLGKHDMDKGGQVRDNVDELLARLAASAPRTGVPSAANLQASSTRPAPARQKRQQP